MEQVDHPGYTISDQGVIRDPEGNVVPNHLLGSKMVCAVGPYITFIAENVAKNFIRPPKYDEAVGFKDGDIMNCNVDNLYWYERNVAGMKKPTPTIPIQPSKSKHWIRRYNIDGEIVAEYASFKEATEAAHAERPQFKPSSIATRLRDALKNPDRFYCGTRWKISHPNILETSYDDKPKTRPEGWIRCYSVPGRELVKEYASIDEVVRNEDIRRTLSPADVAQRLRECHNGKRKVFRGMAWEVSDPDILQTRKLGMTFVNQLKDKEEEKQEEPAVVDVVVDEVKEVQPTPTNEEPTIAPAVNVVDEVKEAEPTETAESTMETTTNEVIQQTNEEPAETPAEPSVVDEVKEDIQQTNETLADPSMWIKRYRGEICVKTFKDIDETVAYIKEHDGVRATIPALRNILRRHIRGTGTHTLGGYTYKVSGEAALVSHVAYHARLKANIRGWETRHRRMQEEALAHTHETVDEVKEEVNNTLNEIAPITPITPIKEEVKETPKPIKKEVKATKQSSDRPEIDVEVIGDVKSVKVDIEQLSFQRMKVKITIGQR